MLHMPSLPQASPALLKQSRFGVSLLGDTPNALYTTGTIGLAYSLASGLHMYVTLTYSATAAGCLKRLEAPYLEESYT